MRRSRGMLPIPLPAVAADQTAGPDAPRSLHTVVAHGLGELRQRVRRRLGEALRRRGTPEDYLHEVVVDLLTCCRSGAVADASSWAKFSSAVVENTLRDRHQFWSRQCRCEARRQDLDVASLPAAAEDASGLAIRREQADRIRGALQNLTPSDQAVLQLRAFERLSFAAIAARLGCGAEAARMRHDRALERLRSAVLGAGPARAVGAPQKSGRRHAPGLALGTCGPSPLSGAKSNP